MKHTRGFDESITCRMCGAANCHPCAARRMKGGIRKARASINGKLCGACARKTADAMNRQAVR